MLQTIGILVFAAVGLMFLSGLAWLGVLRLRQGRGPH